MRISDWSSDVCSSDLTLVVEPSIQYSHSQVNRFTFLGVEILDTFLIGLLEAQDADRDLYQAAITGRFGITDRLEAEIKVPYIYRDDRISFIIPQIDPDAQLTQDVDGDGIRSEEHTSELQSLMRISYAVFCLKKKTTQCT